VILAASKKPDGLADSHASTADGDVEMDAPNAYGEAAQPLGSQDEDDEAAVEMAASSPLSEKENDPFDVEMTPFEGDDDQDD